MAWIVRRRQGYGFAIGIAVSTSAWAHLFLAFIVVVWRLWSFAGHAAPDLALLIPVPIVAEMPKYEIPRAAEIEPARNAAATGPHGMLRSEKATSKKVLGNEMQSGFLAILGSSSDGRELSLVFGTGGLGAEMLDGVGGVVVGGTVVGAGSGEGAGISGIGGLGLRGKGGGGSGHGVGTLGTGLGRSGGTAQGATAIAISEGTANSSPLRSEWTHRVGSAIGSRWMKRLRPSLPNLHEAVRINLRIVVDTEGSVSKVDIVQSTGTESFDQSALEAVRESRLPAPPDAILDEYGHARTTVTVVLRFD